MVIDDENADRDDVPPTVCGHALERCAAGLTIVCGLSPNRLDRGNPITPPTTPAPR
jgi:hypothetical protein